MPFRSLEFNQAQQPGVDEPDERQCRRSNDQALHPDCIIGGINPWQAAHELGHYRPGQRRNPEYIAPKRA